jgi:hypothetical protein
MNIEVDVRTALRLFVRLFVYLMYSYKVESIAICKPIPMVGNSKVKTLSLTVESLWVPMVK